MKNTACCPDSAIGVASRHPEGTGQWTVIEGSNGLESMDIYVAGADIAKAGKLILLFTDVFGVRLGNHQEFADTLAQKLSDQNACVVVPDLFRKNPALQPWFAGNVGVLLGVPAMVYRLKRLYHVQNTVDKDIMQLVLPFLESKRPALPKEGISLVGFCYGGYLVPKIIEKVPTMVKCSVVFHPAWTIESDLYGGTVESLATACGSSPIMMMPAGDDSSKIKPGSEALSILSAAQNGKPEDEISIVFTDMVHGFVSRDDLTLKNQKSEQERAMDLCFKFIQKHY